MSSWESNPLTCVQSTPLPEHLQVNLTAELTTTLQEQICN